MPALILLHGALGSATQTEPLAGFLRQYHPDVFTMEFPWHGKAGPGTNGFGIDAFALALEQFIHTHHLTKPDVFGYSMGGYVALRLAHLQPGLLGRIATLATKFDWSPEAVAREVKLLDPATILQKVPKFAEALQASYGDGWKDLLQKTAGMMTGLGHDPLLVNNALENIGNKVMLGLGDSDNMVGIAETLAIRSQLKNGSLYVLPATKHPLESANLKVLGNVLLSFLS